MRKEIKVVPNAGIDEVMEKEGILLVKAPAKDNRANAAVIKLLRKYFRKDVRLVSGLTGRKKIVEISV